MISLILINTVVVSLAVVIHYEFLYRLSELMPKVKLKHRTKIAGGVFLALLAHSVEVWLFALAYYLKHGSGKWGGLEGNFDGSFMDCVHFSYSTYTTLGFGDIVPVGDIRYLTGIESLTGLVLITWTASYLFIEMQKHWK